MGTFRPWAMLVALSLVWLTACGGSSSTLTTQNPAGDAPQASASLPAIWELDALVRGTSAFVGEEPVVKLGDDFLLEFNGTPAAENSLELRGDGSGEDSERQFAWGLYHVSGLLDTHAPRTLNVQALPSNLGDKYFLGLANFTQGSWDWSGPISLPEFELDLTSSHHSYISELGNMYFILVTEEGVVTHSRTTLLFGQANNDTGLPGAPRELTATKGAHDDRVIVHWGGGTNHTHFELFRRVDGTNSFELLAEPEGREYADTAVEPGTVYIYKARAVNAAGKSGFSNTDHGFAGSLGNDNCPGELWASDGSYADKVRLEWHGNPQLSYEVYRRPADGEHDFAYVANSEGTSYNDYSAETGVTYEYKVALEQPGELCWSNVDTGFRAQNGGGDDHCPSELGASDGAYSAKVVLEWNGTAGKLYKIYRRVAETENEFALIGSTSNGTVWHDTTGEPEVVYAYKVALYHEGEHECWSNIDTGFRAGENNENHCPTELGASDGTHAEKVVLEWHGTVGKLYKVYRKVAETENEFALIGSTDDHTSWYDTTAEPGVVYAFKVALYHEEEPLCWSNINTGFRAEPGGDDNCPSELTASKGEFDNKVKLFWSGNETKGYDIFRKTDGEGEWAHHGYSESGLHWYDEQVEPGVVYIYKIGREQPDAEMCYSNTDHGWAGSNE